MDFFKSVFSEDAEPSNPEITPTSSPDPPSSPSPSPPNPSPSPNPKISTTATAWSFGSSLMKTLATKSESVIQTYRRDLEEFGSGLTKEAAVIRQAAGRAVKDLPGSLEAGAAAAQESLESVGQAIDTLGNTVTEFIVQQGINDSDSDVSDVHRASYVDSNAKPYSRLDAQIRAIQSDINTYCEEPEDLGVYNEWKLGFALDERAEEIEDLLEENGAIDDIYREVVPRVVDDETFWGRYFYRVFRVMRAEEARVKLVKRAISGEEEELSWDVEDDDYEESGGSKLQGALKGEGEGDGHLAKNVEEVESGVKALKVENDDKEHVADEEVDQKGNLDEAESSGEKLEMKTDEKANSEGKNDNGGSCKDSDFSVVSSQPSREEEDLGWDEIEDIESGDDAKLAARDSPNKADLRKRLSAAEEEEDLTWDIEDDDEPVGS
ncbi:hypothetical protein RJ640_016380 [Escallonia rubra]|uniref:BSD domain-containing protein n=1 Tax=Escallonia rubra TaxID=112253 RepID=A0AA88RH70_9ASTE|nr:hypothetical protein RJ640_016380 [Escallonia rubra]